MRQALSDHDSSDTEAAIVGGGPVGLAPALFLDGYGVRSVIFNTEPTTRWHPKGNTHNQRTMEHFRRIGLADPIRRLGLPPEHPLDVAYYTRFNGFEIARFHIPSKSERLAMRAGKPVDDQIPEPTHRVNQMYVERVLLEHARTRPDISMRFGWEVIGFAPDGGGVTVHAREVDGGRNEGVRAQYLVGCDGGRSPTRKALGIGYEREHKLMNVFMGGAFNSIHMRMPTLYRDLVGGRPAWMIIADSNLLPAFALLSGNPAIKTLQDLEGKNVGSGTIGALTSTLTSLLLEKHGVDVSNVRFVRSPTCRSRARRWT